MLYVLSSIAWAIFYVFVTVCAITGIGAARQFFSKSSAATLPGFHRRFSHSLGGRASLISSLRGRHTLTSMRGLGHSPRVDAASLLRATNHRDQSHYAARSPRSSASALSPEQPRVERASDLFQRFLLPSADPNTSRSPSISNTHQNHSHSPPHAHETLTADTDLFVSSADSHGMAELKRMISERRRSALSPSNGFDEGALPREEIEGLIKEYVTDGKLQAFEADLLLMSVDPLLSASDERLRSPAPVISLDSAPSPTPRRYSRSDDRHFPRFSHRISAIATPAATANRSRSPTPIISLNSAPSPTPRRYSRSDDRHFPRFSSDLGHRNAPRVSIAEDFTPAKQPVSREDFSPRNLRDDFHHSFNSREDFPRDVRREDFSPRSLRRDFRASERLRDDYPSSTSSREDFLPTTSSRERFTSHTIASSERYAELDDEYSPRSRGGGSGGMRHRPRPRSTSHRSEHSDVDHHLDERGRPRDRSRSLSPGSRFRRSFQR